jgi:hypothetical protein
MEVRSDILDTETAAVPEEYTKVLGISDYVKEPAHLESAVRAATEVWDVVTGKGTASGLMEGMRAQNPQQFEKTVFEDLVPYIEKITGKKFGGEEAAPDPMAQLQAEVERLKNQPIIERQERDQAAYRTSAEQAGGKHIEALIENGNGIFDGDTAAAVQAVSAQFAKMGVNADDVMKQVMAGKFDNLEKAYKAAEKQATLQAKAYSDRIRARYLKLKNATPSTGTSSAAATSGD